MPYLTAARKGRGTFEVDVEGRRLVVDDRPEGSTAHAAGPTPAQLLVSSLAASVASCAEAYLARSGLPAEGLGVTCHYRCAAARPHTVSSVDVTVSVPVELAPDRRSELLRAVGACGRGFPDVAFMLVSAPLTEPSIATPAVR